MISIDIEQLNKISNEITPYLDSTEEDMMNLFSKLKNATNDWYDPISISFDEAMINESNDSQQFLSEIKLRKNIFSYITDLYSNLGKKINYDYDNKDILIKLLNDCISECTSILNEFNNIDNSFYYYEYYIILNQKAKIVDSRIELRKLKDKLTKKFQTIAEYEENIDSKIGELEPFKILEFDTNYVKELKQTKESYIYPDLLLSDINNIDMYKTEENKDLNLIFDGLNRISEGYVSINVTNYKNDCKELRKNVDTIESNRIKYITELKNQLSKYETIALNIKEKFDKKDVELEKNNGED